MLELTFGKRKLVTERPAFVMGIVNVTPDSFYSGSRGGIERALELVEQGAEIIDIGGESTRPGFTPVSEQEELERVIPVICELRQKTDVVISVDSTKPLVIQEALKNGADIINNILSFDNITQNDDEKNALKWDLMTDIMADIKKYEASVILMHHTAGNIEEICSYLKASAEKMRSYGIPSEKIIIDPGIGFGKSFEQNVSAIKNSDKLCELGYTVLMALSRKSSIGMMTGREVADRLSGTVTADIISVQKGAKIIRVHDVSDAIDSLNVMKFLK